MGHLFSRALLVVVFACTISAPVVHAQSDGSDASDAAAGVDSPPATVNLVDRLRAARANQELAYEIVRSTMDAGFDGTIDAGVNDQLVTARIGADIYSRSGDVWLSQSNDTRQAYIDSVLDALSAALPGRAIIVEFAAGGRNGMSIQIGRMGTDGSRSYTGFN